MKRIYFLLMLSLYSTFLLAQEGETKKINVDINTGTSNDNWYASPWVWVVGAAVLILLLVALTRGNRRTD
ncbi:MAG TPA: hypothetical protein VF609_01055 [Flavisolibacter sp.]